MGFNFIPVFFTGLTFSLKEENVKKSISDVISLFRCNEIFKEYILSPTTEEIYAELTTDGFINSEKISVGDTVCKLPNVEDIIMGFMFVFFKKLNLDSVLAWYSVSNHQDDCDQDLLIIGKCICGKIFNPVFFDLEKVLEKHSESLKILREITEK